MGWKEELKKADGAKAFRLINDPRRRLTRKQIDALWNYWKRNRVSFDYWSKPENWIVDNSEDE